MSWLIYFMPIFGLVLGWTMARNFLRARVKPMTKPPTQDSK